MIRLQLPETDCSSEDIIATRTDVTPAILVEISPEKRLFPTDGKEPFCWIAVL